MDNLLLIPYTTIDGVPTLKDSGIMDLYDRMEKDDTARTVFYDGSVRSRADFLRMMRRDDVKLYVAFLEREPVAIMWLTDCVQRSAQGHFCFFSNAWGRAGDIGREVVGRLLTAKSPDGEYVFDVLWGCLPQWNHRAIGAVRAAGAEDVGIMPSRTWSARDESAHPAHIVSFTRESVFPEGVKK